MLSNGNLAAIAQHADHTRTMYVACLTPEADPLVVRRTLCGVPCVDVLALRPSGEAQGSVWLLDTLMDLRRELFLDPELQLVAGVPAFDHQAVREGIASMLVELHEPNITIGSVVPPTGDQLLTAVQAEDHAICNRVTRAALPSGAVIESVGVRADAAPIIETIQSGAKIVLASDPLPGALGTAAAFESLHLQRHDWDHLATVATIARIVENPGRSAPLWMEIGESGHPFCLGTESLTAEAIHLRVAGQRAAMEQEADGTTVAIDLSSVQIVPTGNGRFQLNGIQGAPPKGNHVAVLVYRNSESEDLHSFPTSVHRTAMDWNVMVKSASEWNAGANSK